MHILWYELCLFLLFSPQMIQAIQVLRFHLLELEKVNIIFSLMQLIFQVYLKINRHAFEKKVSHFHKICFFISPTVHVTIDKTRCSPSCFGCTLLSIRRFSFSCSLFHRAVYFSPFNLLLQVSGE